METSVGKHGRLRALRPEEAEPGREAGVREPGPEGPGGARDLSNPDPGGTTMTNPNPSRGARALVLAGPAFAFLATVFCLVTGTRRRLHP